MNYNEFYNSHNKLMSIKPLCDMCKTELKEFGAIFLSPPKETKKGVQEVVKMHLCKSCYAKILKFMQNHK